MCRGDGNRTLHSRDTSMRFCRRFPMLIHHELFCILLLMGNYILMASLSMLHDHQPE